MITELGGRITRQISHFGIRGLLSRMKERLLGRNFISSPDPWEDQFLEPPTSGPLISILVPVYNPEEFFLHDLIRSVLSQTYTHWELCLTDDAADQSLVREVLEKYTRQDTRIRSFSADTNEGIAAATNRALSESRGELVAFVDHDDLLSPHALAEVVHTFAAHPQCDVVYSDEDKVDAQGRRGEVTRKPAWSPSYFSSFMYVGHLTVYRRALVDQVGGFRSEMDGSQDYDLLLRAAPLARDIVHIPKVLYHWRVHPGSVASHQGSKSYAYERARCSLEENLRLTESADIDVEHGLYPGLYRIRRKPKVEKAAVHIVRSGSYPFVRPQRATSYIDIVGTDLVEAPIGSMKWRESVQQLCDESSAEYFFFAHGALSPLGTESLTALYEAVQCPGALAASPHVLADDRAEILYAGSHIDEGEIVNSHYKEYAYGAGYSFRLWTVREVSLLSFSALFIEKRALMSFLLSAEEWEDQAHAELELSRVLKGEQGSMLCTPYARFTSKIDPFSARNVVPFDPRFELGDPYMPSPPQTSL